jgi:hypothetical protein
LVNRSTGGRWNAPLIQREISLNIGYKRKVPSQVVIVDLRQYSLLYLEILKDVLVLTILKGYKVKETEEDAKLKKRIESLVENLLELKKTSDESKSN